MSDTRDVARCWAGFASLGAGLVHLAAVQGVAWLALSRTGERPVRAGRYLLLVGAGALAVACMTTPALAATGAESSHGEEIGH